MPTNHPLYKKKVFFIGRLASRPRKEVIAKLEMVGGVCREKLTPKVDIVVVGENPTNSPAKALAEAHTIQKDGRTKLQILTEAEFYTLLQT